MSFDPVTFAGPSETEALGRWPVSLSEWAYAAPIGNSIVQLGAAFFCADYTTSLHSELCRSPGVTHSGLNDGYFTFDITAGLVPAVGPPVIAYDRTDPDNPAPIYATMGDTLNDFTPEPAFMTARIDWGQWRFRSYNNGCYIEPVASRGQGCGPSTLNRPGVFFDVGDTLVLDVRRPEDDYWYRAGLERAQSVSGLVEMRATEDTGPSGWPLVLEPPDEEQQFAFVPEGSAYVKIPDAVDLAAAGGYTYDLTNDASRYLLPWGALDALTVRWPTDPFGEIVGEVRVWVRLYFWTELGVAPGPLMLVV